MSEKQQKGKLEQLASDLLIGGSIGAVSKTIMAPLSASNCCCKPWIPILTLSQEKSRDTKALATAFGELIPNKVPERSGEEI